jgi:hypothetical protein
MEYDSATDFEKDAFTTSDGWSWGWVHNCLKGNSEMLLNGYEKGELKINKNFKVKPS